MIEQGIIWGIIDKVYQTLLSCYIIDNYHHHILLTGKQGKGKRQTGHQWDQHTKGTNSRTYLLYICIHAFNLNVEFKSIRI